MRIAQVCPYDMDRSGGVQSHVRDTATALAGLGHAVTVIAPFLGNARSEWAVAGVPLVRIGSARKISFGATSYEISAALGAERGRLDRVLEEGAFEVIHYHTMWTPILPFQVFRRSRAANVATFHDTAPRTPSGAVLRTIFRAMSRRLLPRLDAVIAPSEAPLEHLGAARGVTIRIVPPATDLRRFAEAPEPPRRFADTHVNILFLGRLEKRKGIDLLITAFRQLVREELPVRLLIAGAGEDEAKLRSLAAGLAEVVFLGRFANAQVPALLAESDIVCAPSPYGESFGIVIAEAMASGRAVVAAANAGYRFLLGSGEAGQFLTPPGDAAALAKAIGRLVRDQPLRSRLGAWGRVEAMRYDCRAIAPLLVAIYEEAIARLAVKRSAVAKAPGGR
jgi:glycosyltransferase involved in cell wall biosynthesis